MQLNKETLEKDPCNFCGKTLREQMKGCNEITCYRQFLHKQETLDESKLRQLFKNRSNCYADAEDVVQAMDENCFIETIKEWQAKRMYSEGEVLQLLLRLKQTEYYDNLYDWFEQFKKK
jgi:hypothetical protein